jgi:Na+/H+ antiporter NhaD/arsenite permease-like protein
VAIVTIEPIFSLLFVLIIIILVTGRYHRSVAALLGALLTIFFGLEYGLFSEQNIISEIISFINVDTVLLVIGVMILAEAVSRTGFFEFIGLSIAKTVGGGFRRISIAFIILTILFSAIISNVTTMIVVGALTISLAKKFRTDPTQILLYESLMANVGGLTLMISSIPNLIVTAHLGIGFLEFFVITAPLTLLISAITLFVIWRRISRMYLFEEKVDLKVDPWSAIKDKRLFYRAATIFIIVIVLFIFENSINLPIGLIAMGGAIAMLILGEQEPESIFSEIDWGTIFFLTAFYIVVGGLMKSGVIDTVANGIVQVLSFNHAVTPVLNVWVSGVPSAIVDNIPMTLTLIPIMEQVSAATGFSFKILGWSIVFGANLGGGLTPIGSASNIIALGILKKEGKKVSWKDWFSIFGPLVILQLIIATIYITILSAIL